jgi:signal transduction histidine kinase
MATLGFLREDEMLTQGQREDVNAMFTASTHMQRLVNDVLDLAKLRDGTLQISVEEVRPSLLTNRRSALRVCSVTVGGCSTRPVSHKCRFDASLRALLHCAPVTLRV